MSSKTSKKVKHETVQREKKTVAATPAVPLADAAVAESPPSTYTEATLKQAETDEARLLRELLYDDALAKLDKRDDFLIPTMTRKEKIQGFKRFAAMLTDPCNRHVFRVFLTVSMLMFTAPIVGLFVGMYVLAPVLDAEKDVCGGVTAVVTVVVIMFGYVIFALGEDECFNEKLQQQKVDEAREHKRKQVKKQK